MAWQKIDDRMVEHAKIAPLSDGAFRAMVEMWAYASRNLTDGLVPTRDARRIGTAKQLTELVDAGLFHVVTGGWVAHDWLDHNPPAIDVKAKREAEAARLREIRKRGRT